jgi:hypothetical protein
MRFMTGNGRCFKETRWAGRTGLGSPGCNGGAAKGWGRGKGVMGQPPATYLCSMGLAPLPG